MRYEAFLFTSRGAIAALLIAATADAAKVCPANWFHSKLLPHEDCHKYYKCSLGRPIEQTCPGDLFFNTILEECDWQYNVDCGDRIVPTPSPCDPTLPPTPPPCNTTITTPPSNTTTTSTTTTTTTTTTPAPTPPTSPPTTLPPWSTPITNPDGGFLPNGCPVNPHVHWLLPVPGDCNGFYYCVWGQLVQRACPPGLHFNKPIQVCDWTWRAKCTN